MTLLLQAANICHAHGGNQLFAELSFQVKVGDRLALVGENGAGKSTLFQIMAKRIVPTGGIVTHARGLALGFLSQESEVAPELTARAAVAAAGGDPAALEGRLRELEAAMGTAADDDALAQVMDEYGVVLARLEAESGVGGLATATALAAEALAGLGFPADRWETPVGQLSGGEKQVVGVARLLLEAPDLLLLDEPDNHLDDAAKGWLERWLRGHRGAVALISHDRWFIDQVVNRIFELEDGRIEAYPGNYRAFLAEKRTRRERSAQLREVQEREFKKLKESAEQLTQWARQNPKFAPRAENQRRKLAEERERLARTVPPPLERRRIDVEFEAERGGTQVLAAAALSKSYGARTIFAPFDLTIRHGERVGLVGPNGSGKTTLFRLILGQEAPTSGQLKMGPSIRLGVYRQEQEGLDPAATPLEMARQLKPLSAQAAIGFLHGFLFSRDDALTPIGRLSGGERARLQMAALVLQESNFLLLDEPTNNLDLPSIGWLEEALGDFPGTILAISHDRYFLDTVCDRIVEVRDGVVRDYPGGFAYYQANRERGTELTIRPPVPLAPERKGKARGKGTGNGVGAPA